MNYNTILLITFKIQTMYEKIDVTLDAFQSGSNQLIRANLKGNYSKLLIKF